MIRLEMNKNTAGKLITFISKGFIDIAGWRERERDRERDVWNESEVRVRNDAIK
jgi:hypothetical protein